MQKNDTIRCAPILVTTLCRYRHFIRLIESLKRNTWAKYTDVYVGVDFPSKASHYEGYNKINQYLDTSSFKEFKGFHVIRRNENFGSLRNMTELRNSVLEIHDCFIRTDDDAEFSANFIEYMNTCLERYRHDPEVFAITGYSYPMKWKVSDGSSVFKQNFICPVWGIGFWKDKYNEMYNSIVNVKFLKNEVSQILQPKVFGRMMNTSQSEFVDLCLSPDYESTLAALPSDIALNMYIAIKNKFVIMPTISKVRNWGFDGSGEYCADSSERRGKLNAYNYPYHLQPLDENDGFSIAEDTLQAVGENRKLFNSFDVLPLSTRTISKIKLFLYKIVGKNMFFKIVRFVRRIKTK